MNIDRAKKIPETAVAGKAKPKRQEGMRETIEAVAIAFILAFVFKTFEAEAFVIPTGSMAPTLYGRHKEVTCSGCNMPYTIGASQEVYRCRTSCPRPWRRSMPAPCQMFRLA